MWTSKSSAPISLIQRENVSVSRLKAKSALAGFSQSYDGITVRELTDFELVSLAVANGRERDFSQAFHHNFEVDPPAPGQVINVDGGAVMWTSPDSYMVMSDLPNDRLDDMLSGEFQGTAYGVLQSDGWVGLELSGDRIMDLMERLVSVDLSIAGSDFATRTTSLHTPIYLLRRGDITYLFLIPRSYAVSYLDNLMDVIRNKPKG